MQDSYNYLAVHDYDGMDFVNHSLVLNSFYPREMADSDDADF